MTSSLLSCRRHQRLRRLVTSLAAILSIGIVIATILYAAAGITWSPSNRPQAARSSSSRIRYRSRDELVRGLVRSGSRDDTLPEEEILQWRQRGGTDEKKTSDSDVQPMNSDEELTQKRHHIGNDTTREKTAMLLSVVGNDDVPSNGGSGTGGHVVADQPPRSSRDTDQQFQMNPETELVINRTAGKYNPPVRPSRPRPRLGRLHGGPGNCFVYDLSDLTSKDVPDVADKDCMRLKMDVDPVLRRVCDIIVFVIIV